MKGIWKNSSIWCSDPPADLVTMGEGNTPLIPAQRIGRKYGLRNLYFKLELTNPTGSYKDRFAAAAVSHLKGRDAEICLATSSGNTGSALAAYCARAGIHCFVIVVDGTPMAKLHQMQLYGAHTLMVKGFGLDTAITDQVFHTLREMSASFHTDIQISAYAYSPEGMSGVETIGLEIAENTPDPFCHIFSPSGGGGLTLAVGRGLQKWKEYNPDYILPRLHCVQPEGNDTIAGPLREGRTSARAIPQSTTKVSGLQVPGVLDGNETLAICRSSGGDGFVVNDELVFQMQADLAMLEGIYCEPAGAVALAGAVRAVEEGRMNPEEHAICLITGHGFKDNSMYQRMGSTRHQFYEEMEGVEKYIDQTIQNSKYNK